MGLPILFRSSTPVDVTGDADGTFAQLVASADAVEVIRGAAGGSAQPLAGGATGREVIRGAAPGTLHLVAGDATAREVITGAAAGTFSLLAGSAGAQEVVAGQGFAPLGALAGAGAGEVTEGDEPPPPPIEEWDWALGVPFIALKSKPIIGRGDGLLPRLRGKAYGRVHEDELVILLAA